MQEKSDHSTEAKGHRRYTSKEERLAHVKQWQESGLAVTEYCRQHNIVLTSFLGWRRSAMKSDQLFKPVSIAPPPALSTKGTTPNVIEIMADASVRIRLLNVSDASLVVNIARGLIKCS